MARLFANKFNYLGKIFSISFHFIMKNPTFAVLSQEAGMVPGRR
jgi:hypothetical protein